MKAELENFIKKVDSDSKLKSELISLTERSIQSTTEERKHEVVNFAKSYGFRISVEDLNTNNEDLDINELKAEYLGLFILPCRWMRQKWYLKGCKNLLS